jgi:hypothetical protein
VLNNSSSWQVEGLERALSTEHTRSVSVNVRGTVIAVVSALALLLLAQFSALWLDDNRWHVPDLADWALRALLTLTVLAFTAACVLAGVAVWPNRGMARHQRDRIGSLDDGDEQRHAEALRAMVDGQHATNKRKSRWLLLASVAFALAIAGTVLQSAIFALAAEPVDPTRTDTPDDSEIDETGLPSPEEQLRLALQYAPRVWLHTSERFGPLDPGEFVLASQLEWHLRRRDEKVESRGNVVAARLGRRCGEVSGGCYEFGGYRTRDLTRPFAGRGRPRNLSLRRGFALDVEPSAVRGQAGRDPDATVFFEFRRVGPALRVTYWFFYGYSRPHFLDDVPGADQLTDRLSHEGDWENVDVALTSDGSAPVAVFFYGHGKPTRVAWTEVCKVGSNPDDCSLGAEPGHPVVYSALDSHASYAKAGRKPVCLKLAGKQVCAVDVRERGFRWDAWTGPNGVRPVRSEAWYGFGGAWGSAGSISDRTGPLGPSRWKLPADTDPGDLGPGTGG